MTQNGWIAISISASPEVSDALANRFMELGSTGIVTEDDAQGMQRLVAYFRQVEWEGARPLVDQFIQALRELFPANPIKTIHVQPVREEDWAEGWKQNFRPTVVSPRLLVCPPWEEPADTGGKIHLVIDPGMAFGTGTHATTRLVLYALDDIMKDWAYPTPPRVLDAGTGSGILSLAAARLGAAEVVGIDNDPIAVATAKENLVRNGLDGRISFLLCSVEDVRGEYDLVLANLTFPILVEKRQFLVQALAPRGFLVASGFLTRDLPELINWYAGEPVRLVRDESMEDWHLAVWQRCGQGRQL